jgi:hypothetical protein
MLPSGCGPTSLVLFLGFSSPLPVHWIIKKLKNKIIEIVLNKFIIDFFKG